MSSKKSLQVELLRRVDRLVATKVLGWKLDPNTRFWMGEGAPPCLSAYPPAPQYSGCDNTYFRPSRSLEDVALAEDKLRSRGLLQVYGVALANWTIGPMGMLSQGIPFSHLGRVVAAGPLERCRAMLEVSTTDDKRRKKI